MKRVVITFGLLAGIVIASFVWIIAGLCMADLISLDRAWLLGYASMLISAALIFFGIKSYRDNYAGGFVTFWKSVQVGLLISFIAALFYWASAIAFDLANPGFQQKFIDKFTETTVSKMRSEGAAQEKIDEALNQMKKSVEMIQNPLVFFLFCMLEILPVCILVTLISAALLRRRELLPQAA